MNAFFITNTISSNSNSITILSYRGIPQDKTSFFPMQGFSTELWLLFIIIIIFAYYSSNDNNSNLFISFFFLLW